MTDAKNDGQDAADSDAVVDVTSARIENPVPLSLAARRRRIEKLRERQELMALLDDFGDGDFDLELLDEDEDDTAAYVASEDQADGDDEAEDAGDLDDDDDFIDDDFEDEDEQ